MDRQLRYWGEFQSNKEVLWRIELHQDGKGVTYTPSEIILPGNPLEISWDNFSKLDVVECSSATLNIVSDSDRRFLDLYQVEFGVVLLKVYRNGELYWSGTLDTELYEEPYSYKNNYDTTLTFSDFAPLSRLNNTLSGIPSLDDILNECLKMLQVEYLEVVKYISSYYNGDAVTLAEFRVLSDNFYDEEGEPSSFLDILTETLKPFALKLRQKNGKIYIYDLNALTSMDTTLILWDGTDAVISTSETFNKAAVTFSPYATTTVVDGTLIPEECATDDTTTGKEVRVDIRYDSPTGFIFSAGDEGGSNVELSGGAKFFRITPRYSGSEEAGVAYVAQSCFPNGNGYEDLYGLNSPENCAGEPLSETTKIISLKPGYIAIDPIIEREANKYALSVGLDVLFDVRYTPFEPSQLHNEEGNWSKLVNWCNLGYVGVKIYVTSDNGDVLCHYKNSSMIDTESYRESGCGWVSGPAADFRQCYLAYYDMDDRRSNTGFGGWQSNKRMIGFYQGALPENFKYNNGAVIPLPPHSGWLHFEISDLVFCLDYNKSVKPIYERVRWVLYRNPKIEVVDTEGFGVEFSDIEESAWVNESAKEGIEVATIVGTMETPPPTARGVLKTSNNTPLRTITRGGYTDTPERLLLATVYSQYAQRGHILSGTVVLESGFGVFSEANTDGVFWTSSEVQRVAVDESDIAIVTIFGDNYEALNYE